MVEAQTKEEEISAKVKKMLQDDQLTKGRSGIHHAVTSNSPDLLARLIPMTFSERLTAKDCNEKTPLDYANSLQRNNCRKILKNALDSIMVVEIQEISVQQEKPKRKRRTEEEQLVNLPLPLHLKKIKLV